MKDRKAIVWQIFGDFKMDLIKWQLNFGSGNFGLKSYLWFQIELALRARSILKSRVWFQTKLHSTQFKYHYLSIFGIIHFSLLDFRKKGNATLGVNTPKLGGLYIINQLLTKLNFSRFSLRVHSWKELLGHRLPSCQRHVHVNFISVYQISCNLFDFILLDKIFQLYV